MIPLFARSAAARACGLCASGCSWLILLELRRRANALEWRMLIGMAILRTSIGRSSWSHWSIGLIIGYLVLRPRQRVKLTDSVPVRPHMPRAEPSRRRQGLSDEVAAATSDVAGQMLGARSIAICPARSGPPDDLREAEGRRAEARRRCSTSSGSSASTRSPAVASQIERSTHAGRVPRPPRARPGRRAGRLSRARRHRRLRGTSSASSDGVRREPASASPLVPLRRALRAAGEQLVDLAAVHVDDLELSAVVLEASRRSRAYASAPTRRSRRRSHSRDPPGIVMPSRSDSRSALAAPDTSQLPSSRSTSGGSSPSSMSWAKAPASAARMRPGVTMPSKWPYSSWTNASGTRPRAARRARPSHPSGRG